MEGCEIREKGMVDKLAVAPGATFIVVSVPSAHSTVTSGPLGARTANKQPTYGPISTLHLKRLLHLLKMLVKNGKVNVLSAAEYHKVLHQNAIGKTSTCPHFAPQAGYVGEDEIYNDPLHRP